MAAKRFSILSGTLDDLIHMVSAMEIIAKRLNYINNQLHSVTLSPNDPLRKFADKIEAHEQSTHALINDLRKEAAQVGKTITLSGYEN